MGAQNSTPQTVRLDNPEINLAIQVTPSVVSRLVTKEDQSEKKAECSKCIEHQKQSAQQQIQPQYAHEIVQQTSSPNWTQAQDVFEKKYNELEEYQFDKTVEKVEALIGKPLAWVDNIYDNIAVLRQDLIKCYRDSPGQTLNCADVAKQYQQFVQREQIKFILNSNELTQNEVPSNTNTTTQ